MGLECPYIQNLTKHRACFAHQLIIHSCGNHDNDHNYFALQTCDIDVSAQVEKITQSGPYVVILGKPGMDTAQYMVCGEKNIICESKTLIDAILDLIGIYYIFDIIYPKSLAGILLFFQQQVFKIKDEQIPPSCLSKLLSNISALSTS